MQNVEGFNQTSVSKQTQMNEKIFDFDCDYLFSRALLPMDFIHHDWCLVVVTFSIQLNSKLKLYSMIYAYPVFTTSRSIVEFPWRGNNYGY